MTITINGTTGIASVDGSAGSPSIRGDDSNSGIYYGTDIIYMSTGGVQRWKLTDGGDIQVPDSCKFEWGGGQDLAIYHNGTHGYIKGQGSSCGGIYIDNSADADQNIDIKAGQDVYLRTTDGSHTSVRCERGGPVYVYYNNSLKMYTSADGGEFQAGSNGRGLRVRGEDNNCDPAITFRRKSNDGGNSEPARIQMEYFAGTTHESGHLDFYTNGDSGSAALNHRFRIRNDGELFGDDTSIGSLSDERLKKDIADYTYDLSKFKQLRPRTFNWINPSEHIPRSTVVRGFTAQEVEAVDPYWVDENDVRNPKDSALVADTNSRAKSSKLGANDAMYVSVINQLITKIETLEAKVAALEAA